MNYYIPFQKHEAYQKLLERIKSIDFERISMPIIEISGMPLALHDDLIGNLNRDIKQSNFYAERDSLEIRKYFDSIQRFSCLDTEYSEMLQYCINHNLELSKRVNQPGEYARVADMLQIWPPGYEHPLRISYFDASPESAYFFDEIYGKQLSAVDEFLLGDLKLIESQALMSSLHIASDYQNVASSLLLFGGDSLDSYNSKSQIQFDFNYPSLYFHRFDLLEKDLAKYQKEGYKIQILTKHADLLPEGLGHYVSNADNELDAGYISERIKSLTLTDRELFGTIFISKRTKQISNTQARKLLAELEGEIEIGNFVVHEDHGIGVYKGIKQEEFKQRIPLGFNEFKVTTIYEDYLLIAYAEGDELYVPLSQIDKITKYIGPDEQTPRVTRLGKTDWHTITKKVKASLIILARELVQHYALRSITKTEAVSTGASKGFIQFIEDFPYQETDDQKRTEKEIYKDLESGKPMNRLLVGDVGFGKTEMAMRAAYKIAESGKQVVVLCPTTVLAAQHQKVFTERFSGTGFKIASLSRFSAKNSQEIIDNVEQGKIDILVGTHRLLTGRVKFKNLGLLIIDEEQKFGVKQKEKLKQMQIGVHVLSMSATPIPRTLSMALSSIQDISLIQTPPEGRKGVNTFVAKLDYQKISEAINNEVNRGGQVYYLYNRVRTINSIFAKLSKLMPKVRFAIAHGQMTSTSLEKTINDFYNYRYDVLICTTIIENGIDMQNVNTIIIEQAQNFGLGQLYQLRGRVGRGDKQAYAYLFYEGEDINKKDKVEDEEILGEKLLKQKRQHQKYKERLKSIVDFQNLGSGFNLASRDLEIRGAGNLLGKEQHGNISQIGYGLYMQLLAQEIEKLKNNEV